MRKGGLLSRAVHRFARFLQASDRDVDGEEDEGGGVRVAKRGKRTWEEGSEDEGEAEKERRAEEERERDQREKEEFAERLRLKDEEKTRKIMEAKVSKEELEVAPLPFAFLSCSLYPWVPLQRILVGLGMIGWKRLVCSGTRQESAPHEVANLRLPPYVERCRRRGQLPQQEIQSSFHVCIQQAAPLVIKQNLYFQ